MLSSRFCDKPGKSVASQVAEGKRYRCYELPVSSILTGLPLLCWHCEMVKRRRYAFVGHGGLREADVYITTPEDATMRKPESASSPTGEKPFDPKMCEVFEHYPKIAEFLTDTQYDDGTERKLSSLKITAQDGNMRVALDDHDLKQSIYTVGDDLLTCLQLMEGALQSDSVRWYAWGKHRNKK